MIFSEVMQAAEKAGPQPVFSIADFRMKVKKAANVYHTSVIYRF